MSGAVQVSRFGFYNTAQAVISLDGSTTGVVKPPPNSIKLRTFVDGVVGAAVIVPGTQNGMRVTGIRGSVDYQVHTEEIHGMRLVVCSLPGDPSLLAGIINGMISAVGAIYAMISPSDPTHTMVSGLLVPDLTTMVVQGPAPIASGVPNALTVYCDEIVNPTISPAVITVVPRRARVKFGEKRGAIQIPPNTSVAGLFIALREYNGSFNVTAERATGIIVKGALEGYIKSAADVATDGGITPARFGNVTVPAQLAGAGT